MLPMGGAVPCGGDGLMLVGWLTLTRLTGGLACLASLHILQHRHYSN